MDHGIEAVVFDIGNVLIEWAPERFYDRQIGREARERLFAEVPIEAMNLEVDRGAPFRESVFALAEAHPNWAEAIRLWHDRWLEMATPRIDRSVRLMEALKARGVPLYALTNFGVETFAIAEVHYPFLTRFDRAFVSGQMKLIKPDPAIYAAVEQGTGLAPEALFFTDDREENIAAAAGRGWQTHLFRGPAGLAARLVEEGLLTGAEAS